MYVVFYGNTYKKSEMTTIKFLSGSISKQTGSVSTLQIALPFQPETNSKIRIYDTVSKKEKFVGEFSGIGKSVQSGSTTYNATFTHITSILKKSPKLEQNAASLNDVKDNYNMYGAHTITSVKGNSRTADIESQTDLYTAATLCADDVQIWPDENGDNLTLYGRTISAEEEVEINVQNDIISMQEQSSKLDEWNILVPVGENVDDAPLKLDRYTGTQSLRQIYKKIGLVRDGELNGREPYYNYVSFPDVYDPEELYKSANTYLDGIEEAGDTSTSKTMCIANHPDIELCQKAIAYNPDGTVLEYGIVTAITINLAMPNILTIVLGEKKELQQQITQNIQSAKTEVEDYVKANYAAIALVNAIKIVVDDLDANKITVEQLKAINAAIEHLKVVDASIENLKTNKLSAEDAKIKYATIENLKVINETVENLKANEITTEQFNAIKAAIRELQVVSGKFGDLEADYAKVKQAVFGTTTTQEAYVLNLTASNTTINKQLVLEQIAKQMTVGDLIAMEAKAQEITLITKNGRPQITFKDGTQQFYDNNQKVRLQIGEDGNGNFTFALIGADGTSTLLDSNGIHPAGIPDGTIKNQMIGEKTISKDRLSFPVIEANDKGGIDITNVYDGSGGLFGVKYDTFEKEVQGNFEAVDEKIENSIGYDIEIHSPAGDKFRNGEGETILSAHIYSGQEDVTETIDASKFIWTRKSNDTESDKAWNAEHFGGTKQITVTGEDVDKQATFFCTLTETEYAYLADESGNRITDESGNYIVTTY